MKTLGNILWHFPFLGFVQAALTWLIGLVFLITIIGAPIAFGLFEHAKFLMAPFSKSMVKGGEIGKRTGGVWRVLSIITTIIYIPFGIVLAVVNIIQIAIQFVTIINIPVAVVLAKSLGTYFNPVGKKCISKAVKDEMERRSASAELDRLEKAG
ncbi:MAG: hypothetical protein KOO63_03620 [Bacteroidales bacterium]|nr:hypothetical protein [Candidatus Latescibacterota bacterium]